MIPPLLLRRSGRYAMSLERGLDRNEDYRAWKALDEVLRDLEPPRLPRAIDFGVETFSREIAPPPRRDRA